MNLRYSQTQPDKSSEVKEFKYLMNLHYSQTSCANLSSKARFKHLMNLHYSQTINGTLEITRWFKYLMNLHYSQTSNKLHHYYVQGNSQDIVYYISNCHRCQLHTNQNQLYVFLQIRKSFPALMMYQAILISHGMKYQY